MFLSKQAIVIGPTPPGTGDMKLALSFTSSKLTSPTNLLLISPFTSSSILLIPTSMTIAPFLIQLTFNYSRFCQQRQLQYLIFYKSSSRSLVFEWAMVTVQDSLIKSCAIGLPTIFDLPITIAFFPIRLMFSFF